MDTTIAFRQLKMRGATNDKTNEMEMDIMKAAGANDFKSVATNKLNRIVQLSGFSDPVYAEAYVDIHQYDILLGMFERVLSLYHGCM